MVDVFSAGALTLAESSMEMPSIDDFLPPEILFQGTPFAINRIIFVRILATIIMLLVLGITAARARLGAWPLAGRRRMAHRVHQERHRVPGDG